MNPKPITGSPLRQSMIEQMELRGLAPRTIKTYVGWVSALSRHFRRSPARIQVEEANAHLLELVGKRKLAWSTVKQALNAIRFFYRHVLEVSDPGLWIPPLKRPQRLPEVLSREEAVRSFNAHLKLRYRAALHVLYGCGFPIDHASRSRYRLCRVGNEI